MPARIGNVHARKKPRTGTEACPYGRHSRVCVGAAYMRPMKGGEKTGSHICDPYTNKFPLSGFFNNPTYQGIKATPLPPLVRGV